MLVLVILLKQNFNFANLSLRSHRYLILYLRVGVLVGVIAIVAVGMWVGVCSGATTNGQDLDFGLRSLVWHISNATFAHQ